MTEPLYEHGNFADLIGYRLTAWRQHEAEIALEVDARHMNRSGRLHGGVLATVIDAACGFAGCYQAPPGQGRRAMTLSLNTQYIVRSPPARACPPARAAAAADAGSFSRPARCATRTAAWSPPAPPPTGTEATPRHL